VPAPLLFVVSGLTQYLGAALAVGIFGTIAAASVAWLRIAVAAVVLVVWQRPWRSRWHLPDLRTAVLFGAVLALMNVAFYIAIDHLPLAIYILHNFMKDIPPSLVEAARMDGAGHVKIFFQVLMPLLTPAIASVAIFQFLWVWNDLLVALTFAGGTTDVAPLTVRLAELSGTRGSQWQLLSAGAFIALVVPLIVFLSLQRYFVRGLLAGSVKG
jgi:alpha-glucoside transport system permease protein